MENLPKFITKLDHWRVTRGYTFDDLGGLLGVSAQSAFRYCLHPKDENHRRPNKTAGKKLHALTSGSLNSDNYDELVCRETGEPHQTPDGKSDRSRTGPRAVNQGDDAVLPVRERGYSQSSQARTIQTEVPS